MNERVRRGLVVFAIALGLRGLVVLWARDVVPPTADGAFYHVVAGRIAEGLGYTWAWPDGTVTYAAHYPVGYPALLGCVYRLFGASPVVAMTMNALLGALVAPLALVIGERLVSAEEAPDRRRKVGLCAGLLAATSPSLVAYSAALMTEALVGLWTLVALFLVLLGSERRGVGRVVLFGISVLALGAATLTRPQSVLLAPVVGFLALPRAARLRRFATAATFAVGALAVTLPWTLRNCEKMERCVFVSANGGWNLLIGTYPEGRGAWVPIDGPRVPEECRTVFQEAAKDACFGVAGRRRLLADVGGFLRLIPDKWKVTFDYTGSAADHLAASGALGDGVQRWLAGLEIASHRLLGAAALAGVASLAPRRLLGTPRRVLLLGLTGFALSAYGSFLVLAASSLLVGLARRQPTLVLLAAALAGTFAVHAVFFGAGRYFLPLVPLLIPVAALGFFPGESPASTSTVGAGARSFDSPGRGG